MKRAIVVTTSTVVGVASVLAYKPNSDTARALLDITGANNTSTKTQTVNNAQPTAAASTEPAAQPTATPKATTTPQQTKAKASATPKPTSAAATTPTPTQTAPTQTPTPTPTKTAAANKTITGDAFSALSHGHDYGTVTVTVTLVDGKMTKISAVQDPEGRNLPYIQAVRQYLIPAVLKAQQAEVGYVSGATGTSEAFVQSLQSALAKA